MAPNPKRHVKSGTTSTPAVNSKREIERILRRYDCRRVQWTDDFEDRMAAITFWLPSGAVARLQVSATQVYDRLWPDRLEDEPFDENKLTQAERVAWRNLVLLVDAAFAAVECGVRTIEETFLADLVIQGEDGHPRRFIEDLDQHPWRERMLPPGRGDDG